MKNEITENGENRFGMALIDRYKKMPVESLKFNEHYQRAREPARKEKVKQGIISCGYFLPEKSITVNQNNEVVDGQHRLWAARELELSHIPVAKYYFENKDKEAAFFVYINGFDERLKSIDYWYAMFLSGDPLAETLYRLESDSWSLLKDNIVIKGKKTEKTKIGASHVLDIIGVALGGSASGNWKKADHAIWLNKLSQVSFDHILTYSNTFVSWYETIFGDKKTSPWAYYMDSFRAIHYLYSLLLRKGWAHKKDVVQKMKTFSIDATFMAAPAMGKKYQLIDHFNKNRQKQRLPYNIE